MEPSMKKLRNFLMFLSILFCYTQHRFVNGLCKFNGLEYQEYSFWSNNCNNCTCINSVPFCEKIQCKYEPCEPGQVLMLSDDECCPSCQNPKNSCIYEGFLINHNAEFSPKICTTCKCKDGQMQCIENCHEQNEISQEVFKDLQQSIEQRKELVRQQRLLMIGYANQELISEKLTSSICLHDNKIYQFNTTWSPLKCTQCICSYNSLVDCYVHECPKLDCPYGIENDPDQCCPKCKSKDTCFQNSVIYNDGEFWTSKTDPCLYCSCFQGQLKCFKKNCSSSVCEKGDMWVKKSNECCAQCVSKMSENCEYHGKLYYNGEMWYTNGCQHCACVSGRVICMNVECESKFCLKNEIMVKKKDDCCVTCRKPKICTINNKIQIKENEFWLSNSVDLHQKKSSNPCKLCQCIDGKIECYTKSCQNDKYPTFAHLNVYLNEKKQLNARTIPFLTDFIKSMSKDTLIFVSSGPKYSSLYLNDKKATQFKLSDIFASRIYYKMDSNFDQENYQNDYVVLSLISHDNPTVHNILIQFELLRSSDDSEYDLLKLRKDESFLPRSLKHLNQDRSIREQIKHNRNQKPRKTIFIQPGEAIKITSNELKPKILPSSTDAQNLIYFLVSSKPKYGDLKLKKVYAADEIIPIGWTKVNDLYLEKSVREFTQADLDNGNVWYEPFNEFPSCGTFGFDDQCTGEQNPKYDHCMFEVFDQDKLGDLISKEIIHFSIQNEVINETVLGLEVIENQITPLTFSNFDIAGIDSSREYLMYRIIKSLGKNEGQLEHANYPGIPIETFTQKDLNKGLILYHSPKEIGPNPKEFFFTFVVTNDNRSDTFPETPFHVKVMPANDQGPIFTESVSEIKLLQSASLILPRDLFDVQDPDTPLDDLVFKIEKAPENNVIELRNKGQRYVISKEDSFTIQEIRDGTFRLINNGANINNDSFKISVSDNKHMSIKTIKIKVKLIDSVAPRISDRSTMFLSVKEAQIKIIKRENIAFLDDHSSPEQIFYRLNSKSKLTGRLYNKNKLIEVNSMFTQADIDLHNIRYESPQEIGQNILTEVFSFDVSDKDGNEQKDQLFTIKVEPVDNQAPVVQVVQDLAVEESKYVILNESFIQVRDVDSSKDQLNVIIDSQPNFGYLENIHKGTKLSSFPLVDLIDGFSIRYVQSDHKNKEPSMDAFMFHVSDGVNESPTHKIAINIQIVNDEKPVAVFEPLQVENGKTTVLTNASFFIVDFDSTPENIKIEVDKFPKHGKLYHSKQEINEKNREFLYSEILKNQISYSVEDQDATKDTILFKISDESFSEFYEYLINIVQEKSDIFVQKNEGLDAIQGHIFPITSDMLYTISKSKLSEHDKIIDYLLSDLVIYKVLSTPEFGRIQLRFDTFYQDILGPYSFMNTFTQNDINEGRVFYNHEANEPTGVTSFAFNVTNSNGQSISDQKFIIAVRGDKIPPVIVQNRGLKVNQGQSILLSRYEFDVKDDDTPLENLKFLIVTQPKLGRLEHQRQPGRRIEFFLYEDLVFKNVRYVHEDVYNDLKNDLIDFRITDGKNDVSASVYVTITRVDNQMPLLKSKFVLNAKELNRTQFSSDEIQVFDRDTPNDALRIIITHPPQYGALEKLISSPSENRIEDQMISLNTNLNQKLNFILKFNNNHSERKYIAVNEFTMKDIEKGIIFYHHLSQGVRQDRFGFIVYDGYNNMFMIDGGIQVSTYQIFNINIEPESNQAPVVEKNLGLNYLHQFDTYTGRVIMKSELLITDQDDPDSDIMIEITRKPLHGFLQHKDRPGLSINRFTQYDLNQNKIYFILKKFDDSITEDFFEFDVYDMSKNYVKQNRFDVRWSVVGFKENEISVMETDGKVRVHIQKTGSLKQFSMVTCTTLSDSAKSNRDSKFFDFVHTNVRIEFNEDESYKACDVIINKDENTEPIESFYVLLEDAKYSILGLRKRVKINILDKEREAVLEFEKTRFEVQESNRFVSLPIVRNGDLTKDVQVECLTKDDSATAGSDYVAKISGAYVRIPAGQMYAFCDIEIIDDHLKEIHTEYFNAYLRNPSDGAKIGFKSQASIGITGPNDVVSNECQTVFQTVTDQNSQVYVEINREKVNITESFDVLIKNVPTEDFHIENYLNSFGQVSQKNLNIAEPGVDFEPINQLVKFLPSETSKRISFKVMPNSQNSFKIFTLQLKTIFSNNIINSCELIDPDFVNIIIGTNDKIDTLVGFNQSSITINETSKEVNVSIIRTGDLSKSFSLICFTKQQTAMDGQDYVLRDNFEQSRIFFEPGEKVKTCSVEILNDDIFEADETFQIKLSDLRGPSEVKLSSLTTITVTILNDEDSCVISLSEKIYYTEEPSSSDSTVVKSVPILRKGDLTRTSHVRVGTSDGTARAGIDYKPKTQVLKFAPGVSALDFEVEIFYDYDREGSESFFVMLGPQDPVSGVFGNIKTATVVIKDSFSNNQSDKIENSPIYLNSLLYHVVHKDGKTFVPVGEPLICLEPCHRNNPKFSSNSKLCQMINKKYLKTSYSWEISSPNQYGEYSQFIKLSQQSFFSQTNESVLEPIYFQTKFRIRCVIEYSRDSLPTIKSNFVQVIESSEVLNSYKLSSKERCEEKWSRLSKQTVSLNSSIPSNFYSKLSDSSLPLLNLKFETPFFAKADYISADFVKNNPELIDYLNFVRIIIEVPYSDGIVPVISTMPIYNIRHLINDEFKFYPNHICSNFIKLSSQDSHLKYGFLDKIELDTENNQSNQINDKLNFYRNNKTLKFYSNLDNDKCVWKITGFFDLTELTSYCQAQIVSSDLSDTSKNYLSIRIPLYVSYLYQSYQATWSSVDYKTNVEAAIIYKTKEAYDHLHVQDEVDHKYANKKFNFDIDKSLISLSVSKISMTENGRLIMEFSTVPSFHGQFIKQRQDGLQSNIVAPSNLNTKFNLELVWSQYTYDYPEQTWKATSTDILNDFSGNYTIHLIPCYAEPNQSFKYPHECEPGELLSYTIPITVEHSNMAVPSKYTLGTRLTLSNNLIGSINPSINNQEFDGEFNKGDTIFGSLIWDVDEDTKSVYRLELDRVYICSSDPRSIPFYDPDGTVYNKGVMFGCSHPHISLKHRILLLDKNSPNESPRFEAQFLNDFLNTSNSTRLNTKKLKKNRVIDGFKFNIDLLFKIDNMTKTLDQAPSQWFIQTMFYIRAGNSKPTRHINIHTLKNVFNNGTNMNIIRLKTSKRTSLLSSKIKANTIKENSNSSGLIKVIIPIILFLIIAILFTGSLVFYKKERLILLFNYNSGKTNKNSIISLARKKFGKNLSNKELKESTLSSTNETMVVVSPLLDINKERKMDDVNLTFQTVVSKSSNYASPSQIDEDNDHYTHHISNDQKSGSSIKNLLDKVFGSHKEHKILKTLSITSEYDDLSKTFLDSRIDEVPQFPKYPTIKRNNYLYFNYNNNRMNYFSSENAEIENDKSEISRKFSPVQLTETIVAVSSNSGSTPTQTTPVSSTTKCALPAVKRLSGTEV